MANGEAWRLPSGVPSLAELAARHVDLPLVVLDADFARGPRILHVNPAFVRALGTSEREAVGQRLEDLLVPGQSEGTDGLRKALAAVRHGRPARAELAVRVPDGVQWVGARLTPAPDEHGRLAYVVGTATGVGERLRIADRLRAANDALRMAAEVGRVGVWEWDLATGELWWDAMCREMFGVDADLEPNLTVFEALVHPDDLPQVRATFTPGVDLAETTFRVVRDDGQTRHALCRGRATVDLVHGGARLLGVMVDITAAQEEADRVVDTLEAMTDAYCAVDDEGRIAYVNHRAEWLLCERREELVGRRLWDAMPYLRGGALAAALDQATGERAPVTVEDYLTPVDLWVEVRAYPIKGGTAMYLRDVSQRRRADQERERLLRAEQSARREAEAAQAELAHQASHDPLTHLLNRPELARWVDGALARGLGVTLLFIDLDRFKLVNDSLGHAAGDHLLTVVARRVTDVVAGQGVVARVGGDEFVIGLQDCSQQVVEHICRSLLAAVREPIAVHGQQLVVTGSIGAARSGPDATTESLLRDADIALYRAKDAGRDAMAWFDETARLDVLERLHVEAGLREALSGDGLVVHYQPAFDLRSRTVAGAEALVRWRHPERGLVGPAAFIHVAEDCGLIGAVGGSVLAQAVHHADAYAGRHDGVRVWANISPRQLTRPGLAAAVTSALEEAGCSPSAFGIEVTESVLADPVAVLGELNQLAAAGVAIAVDDFGTGYSSLARLQAFPVHVLKIDRSFVSASACPRGRDTLRAIVDLGHSFGATVVAEGVETYAELDAVRRSGCDQLAGYLLARPVPFEGLPDAVSRGLDVLDLRGR